MDKDLKELIDTLGLTMCNICDLYKPKVTAHNWISTNGTINTSITVNRCPECVSKFLGLIPRDYYKEKYKVIEKECKRRGLDWIPS